jgi:hypothetical protein
MQYFFFNLIPYLGQLLLYGKVLSYLAGLDQRVEAVAIRGGLLSTKSSYSHALIRIDA